MLKKWFATACLMCVAWFPLCAFEQDLLKIKDVDRIMKQILSEHLGKQELNDALMQHAIEIFINQFDPDRIYLLESEIKPFVNLTELQLSSMVAQYKEGNFETFKKLNSLFQKAILRSRKVRTNIEKKEKDKLFSTTFDSEKLLDERLTQFAKNENELEERILLNLASYIEQQKDRFGESESAQKKETIFHNYESKLRDLENPYLYQSAEGEPLSEAEQENLFSIHVLKALASSLDAHTSFYKSNEAFDMRMRLQKEFQGIGLGLKNSSEGIVVTRLIEGGPADKSKKILPGDILLSVDGKSIVGVSFERVIDMLHGDTKKDIKLGFKRPDKLGGRPQNFDITLKREEVVLNTDRVDYSYVPFGNGIIGKITLHAFYQGSDVSSEQDIRNAIDALRKQGKLKGLVLDLRENTGGFLSQAVKVAGLFISNGVIVISKYASGEKHYYRDVAHSEDYEGPLVVLTSKTTASAAEIVAQALQDYGVALIVGDEQTYGKGTIQTQTVTDSQSSSYFKVTVGEYYTVSGKTPQKHGVKADIIVPSRWHNVQIGETDSIEPDTINPSFEDTLADVKPSDKAWYLKYYIPTLQHRTNEWRNLLPTLIKNSERRLSQNKNFQFFLKGVVPKDNDALTIEEESEWMVAGKPKTYGVDDMQMDEAVNIVEDMIMLHRIEEKEKTSLEKS
jgi:carboxyl-terminal processing protease